MRPAALPAQTARMADIARKASAQWMGDLRSGKGTVSTESGTVQGAQYSFKNRFEQGVGTNPEELLAAVEQLGEPAEIVHGRDGHGRVEGVVGLDRAAARGVRVEQQRGRCRG